LTDLPKEVDVLIAGAGPAGSATASFLANAGQSVLVVERSAFPRDKPCAEYMSPEAVRILNRIGVVAALRKAGAMELEGMKVTACQGATAHGLFARARHRPFRPTGLAMPRRILDHELALAARVAGADLRERVSVEELVMDEGAVAGALVRDHSGRRHQVRARLTVGADGLRSTTARRLGRRSHGRPRRVAFVAHMTGVEGLSGSAELHFGRQGYMGLNRIGPDLTNVAVVVPKDLAAAARGRAGDFFLERLAEFPGVRDRLAASRLVRPVMVTGPFAASSQRVAAPGCLLVGDAADFYDPVTGDGIYSALRGAELIADILGPALRGNVSMNASLRRYQRERRRAFAGKWLMERLTRWMMYSPRFFDRSISRLGRYDDMAHTAIGVAGGFVPVRELLKPSFVGRMVL
jgi:flavin-dependent dehydrogenase